MEDNSYTPTYTPWLWYRAYYQNRPANVSIKNEMNISKKKKLMNIMSSELIIGTSYVVK